MVEPKTSIPTELYLVKTQVFLCLEVQNVITTTIMTSYRSVYLSSQAADLVISKCLLSAEEMDVYSLAIVNNVEVENELLVLERYAD